MAKNITTSPAVLKNIPDCAFVCSPSEPKERSASTGSVPSANESMVSAPVEKLPVVKEYSCMDCVNPQGKKNVATPRSAGVNEWLMFLSAWARLLIKRGVTS